MTAPKTKPVSLEIIPPAATDGGIVLSINLAVAINAAFTTAQTLAGSAREKAQHAIVAAIDCGRLLERQKGILPHGAWTDWLAVNCPEISARTAQRYIRLSKTTHVSFFWSLAPKAGGREAAAGPITQRGRALQPGRDRLSMGSWR